MNNELYFASGNKDDIDLAISKSVIPPRSLIYTDDSEEIYYYHLDCTLQNYTVDGTTFGDLDESKI